MTLAEVIYEFIPAPLVERVVYDQGVLDDETRIGLFKASGWPFDEVVERTVQAYGDQSGRLAYGLYSHVARHNVAAGSALAGHFHARGDVVSDNHQASLVARFPTLPIDQLDEFLTSVRRQVCLIVLPSAAGEPIVRGTGFLVAPSFVLTCRHVLELPNPPGGQPPAQDVDLYFDFFRGEPVERVRPNLPGARRVGLADNWMVVASDATHPDGLEGVLAPADVRRISSSLDYILLRLDQPVGLQPLARGGGRRRGWISLPPDDVPRNLQPQDWIIIPQHPNGLPQRIDLGRFVETDQTSTRIRYHTNTAPGSSGAPCFDQGFRLVGVHNAYVGPRENPVANQAIRLDHIAPRLRALPDLAAPPTGYALRWSVSRDGEVSRPILGREPLLRWLRDSASANPLRLADRAYAAQTAHPKAGCSFSIDVLVAETRETTAPRVVYGERGQLLPATAEDFLISLLREMGIDDLTAVERMPERPRAVNAGGGGPTIVGEVDKLERWLSEELPGWLGRVLTANAEREIDAREVARSAVAGFRAQRLQPPEDLVCQAEAPNPIIVRPHAWTCAYIVIDDLRASTHVGTGPRTDLSGEVQSLIAALVRGRSEAAMEPGLRRLRWMFLGMLPDFIAPADTDGNGATLEVLDPNAVGADDLVSMCSRLLETNFPLETPGVTDRAWAVALVKTIDRLRQGQPRMMVLQDAASDFVQDRLTTEDS